ncbi:MAG: hypothetical protein MUF59_10685 [Candidatus Krumholzibacteria bacterium]|nr:hypothetical protein [Candidatus Krumholzibacteria bacterium]
MAHDSTATLPGRPPARLLPAALPLLFAFIIFCLSLHAGPALACRMEFKVTGGEKENYSPGDTVTVSLTLMLTHGNCLVELADTEFSGTGLEILGATAWKKVRERPIIVEKKLRVLIKGDGSGGDVSIRALRLCERQGGDLSIILVPGTKKIIKEQG